MDHAHPLCWLPIARAIAINIKNNSIQKSIVAVATNTPMQAIISTILNNRLPLPALRITALMVSDKARMTKADISISGNCAGVPVLVAMSRITPAPGKVLTGSVVNSLSRAGASNQGVTDISKVKGGALASLTGRNMIASAVTSTCVVVVRKVGVASLPLPDWSVKVAPYCQVINCL